MSGFVVASRYRWNEHPYLRPGRIYRGQRDISRSPTGESHLVTDAGAAQTKCGLARVAFPYDFPELTQLDPGPGSCTRCGDSTGD